MAVFKAWKGLLHGCGCRSQSPGAQSRIPSVPGGATGSVAGGSRQGIPHVESSPIHRLGCSLLPSPAADRLPCPVRGLRGLHYSIRGAMPACDEMIKQGCVPRALVQGCGRRPAASGTTAWARRRPGGGESARTSRPLTTRRFAATGLSPPSPLSSRCIACFARTPSMAWSRCLGSRPPRASLTCVPSLAPSWLPATQSSKQTSDPRHYP